MVAQDVVEMSVPQQMPTAFITWAHRDPGWDDDQALTWEHTIAAFAASLRGCGVDAEVDLYHLHEPDVDWTRYGPRAIASREFVLVAVSHGYMERWEGRDFTVGGPGAVREADALHGLFDRDQRAFQRRVKLIILPGSSKAHIPNELLRLQRFNVPRVGPDGITDLLRVLTGQAKYLVPRLGYVPTVRYLKAPETPTLTRAAPESDRSRPAVVAAPSEWEVIVRADRAFFDLNNSIEGMPFPVACPDRHIDLHSDRMVIGRGSASRGIAPEIDLSGPTQDPAISRVHAILVNEAGSGWTVLDPGSANGTFVKGIPGPLAINTPTPLRDGDEIHIGAWTTVSLHHRVSSPSPIARSSR